MGQKQNENQQLRKNSTEPDERIIRNWPIHERKAIESFHLKKLCEFNAKDFNNLEAKLITLQSFTGQRDLLSDEAVSELIEYLLDYFPNVAIDEIDNAVKMSAAGLIFDERGQPVKSEHYQNFGAIYLSNILKPYQNYRGSIVKKYYVEEEKIAVKEAKAKEPKKTPEEERETMVTFTLASLESYRNEEPLIALDRIYDFLSKEKLLNLTTEKQQEYEKQAKSIIHSQSLKGDRTALSILEVMKADQGQTLIQRAKGLAVRAYFREIIKSNIDLADMLVIIK